MILKTQNGYSVRDGVMTATQAQTQMESTRKLQSFSKAWDVGDKLSVFFPIIWAPYLENGEQVMEQERDKRGKLVFNENNEPVMVPKGTWEFPVYTCWGHEVSDLKKLNVGTTFIPSLTEIYQGHPVKFNRDENSNIIYDSYGDPSFERIEGDITYQFSKIAPLFIRGMKQEELNKVYSKKFDSDEFRRKAIQDVEDRYDTNKSMNAPRPIIGKVTPYTITEVLVVKKDKYDDPDTTKVAKYTYRLKQEKINELYSLIKDVKFRPHDPEQKWFEVEMTFNGDTNDQKGRAQAGRKAHPVGLPEEYTMKVKNPDAFAQIEQQLESLQQLASGIKAHTYIQAIPEQKIKSALSYYVASFGEYLDSITEERDMEIMKNNASYLVKFAATDAMSSAALKETINNSYAEYLAEHPDTKPEAELATEQPGYSEPDVDHMPTTAELLGDTEEYELPSSEEYM